ncbi:hypothetical protein [Lacipirellula parvula]|uniref:Uncharacterized protein n=1 Tax=Lacipirellula parvula TaxID=2650471 RepID=A0A5K7XGS9_9BACT|nr:hypothetical protein [Lacipirellula parvula]BBO32169.1 hypothetical protein PLANPX_1781 [Lacipirellula parvula]
MSSAAVRKFLLNQDVQQIAIVPKQAALFSKKTEKKPPSRSLKASIFARKFDTGR